MKRPVLIILIVIPCLCGSFDISSSDGIEKAASDLRMHSSYLVDSNNQVVDKRKELEKLIDEINQKLNEESPDPRLLWLRGMAYRNYLSLYTMFEDKDKKGDYEKERKSLIKKYQLDYERALNIANLGNQSRLPASIVAKGTSDVLLTGALNEKVIRYRLDNSDDLTRKIKKNHYSAMSSGYVEEGKYEEALRIINEMYEKFPDEREDLEGSRKRLRAKIEGSKDNAKKEKHKELGSEDAKEAIAKGEGKGESEGKGEPEITATAKEDQNRSERDAKMTAEKASSQHKQGSLVDVLRENWLALGALVVALIAGGVLVVRYRK